MARTPEGKVEDYFVEQCKANGALVRKLAYVARRGAPDRLVVWLRMSAREMVPAQGSAIVDFVELKAPGQKPDPHQEREHERLRALGANVYLIDSKEAVDRYIATRN